VAALDRLLVHKRLLDRVESRLAADPFYGGDVVTGDRPKRRVARRHGIAVEEHVACAALRLAAAKPRPFELQVVAKNVQQRSVGLGVNLAVAPIDSKLQCFGHRLSVSRYECLVDSRSIARW